MRRRDRGPDRDRAVRGARPRAASTALRYCRPGGAVDAAERLPATLPTASAPPLVGTAAAEGKAAEDGAGRACGTMGRAAGRDGGRGPGTRGDGRGRQEEQGT